MQDYLMGKTQLSDNDNAIIDRKSANKYTNPGKKQQNFDKKMQLTPELKNVLEIAQIDSVSAPTKDTSKYRNWEYYKFKFELSGKKFEGTVNIGIDSDGNKHFYEINKIKEVDDISGKNLNRSSASSINNSIASGNKDVNTTAKYSIQESENNSGSFNLSKYDNKGRALSKEQQEYFKDSKVKDEKGNLKEVYHGSNTNGITIFDIDKTSEDNVFGKGFYFTDNELMAESYAEEAVDYNGGTKQIYKGYLNIKNPFVVEGENTVDLANKIRNYDYNADIIDSDYGVASTEKMKEWLISKGYDGIEVKLKKGDGSYYVAFNSNQIKKVDNISPTSNSDIRYSQNNKNWQSYLEDNCKSNGTKTNLQDIKLPTAQKQVAPSMANNKLSKASDTKPNTKNILLKRSNLVLVLCHYI